MIATTVFAAPARLKDRLRHLGAGPKARTLLEYAALPAAGLLLSSMSLAGRPLPLAAALILALPPWPRAPLAALGAGAGYLLQWGWQGALEPLCLTVLFLVAAALFHDTPALAGWLGAGLSAAVGLLFLFARGPALPELLCYAAGVTTAGAAPGLLRRALEDRLPSACMAAGLLLAVGLTGTLPPFGGYLATAGAFAVCVSSARAGMLPTLLCGLALDLGTGFAGGWTPALAAGALLCRLLRKNSAPLRALVIWSAALVWQLLAGQAQGVALACAALGAGLGTVLPFPWFDREQAPPLSAPDSRGRLRRVSRVFAAMHRQLEGIPPAACPSEMADIYDFAAEQVCRMCVRNKTCWQEQGESTYLDLCAAGQAMMQRGMVLREDFPPAFQERCCHMEGFITAVNQELDANLYRRQLRSRLQESRRILSDQYLFFSRFLQRLAEEADRPVPAPQFAPELAVGSACKRGQEISGDRGCTFRDRWGNFYVLLCDGMGTGAEARQESDRAVHMLSGLLEAGVAPDAAMELLNGYYVLQEHTVFSTVDLLQLSLATGTGVLYKWGAAPSYRKSEDGVEKIGTASPPPGYSVESHHTAEQFKLSLRGGETLVLLSDGACSAETEGRITGFQGGTVRDLAGYLAAGAGSEGEDDLTAIVLRLRREVSA